MFNIFQLNQEKPLDLSELEHITDPEEYNQAVHDAIRRQLKTGGLMSPTDNVTNFQLEPADSQSWLDQTLRTVLRNNPEAYDHPDDRNTYLQRRFEFITEHEGWRESVYRDTRNLRTVGYGFNLEEPTNRDLYKQALGKGDNDFNNLRDGKSKLTKREGRILFEASAGAAERLISNKFKDTDLKGYERLALVSLAYNHPALIGPNLTRHVLTGDKKAVMDEILNKSNLHKSKGIQNRRGFEAQMFSGMHEDEGGEWSIASIFNMSAEASTMRSSDELINKGRNAKSAPMPKRKPSPPTKERQTEAQGSFLAGIIPAPARAFISDLFDIDLDTARNEDYLSVDEQEAVRTIALRAMKRTGKRSGSATYDDYTDKKRGVGYTDQISDFLMDQVGLTDKDTSVQNENLIRVTLGKFRFRVDDRGHLIATDRFNFNDARLTQAKYKTFQERLNHLKEWTDENGTWTYGTLRKIGALWGSHAGKGAKWDIDLGPVSEQRIQVASRK